MYCKHCGTKVEENWKACPHCGAVLKEPNSGTPGSTVPVYRKWWFWVIIVLAAALLLLLGLSIFGSGTEKEPEPTAAAETTLSAEALAKQQEEKEQAQRKEYIFPDSDSKYLSEEEVRSVEVDQLRIARNEIFARHGYIFKDQDLKKHFKNTSWYHGTVSSDSFDSDTVFNDFEKKNVELIKQIEDEIYGVESEPSLSYDWATDVANGLLYGNRGIITDKNGNAISKYSYIIVLENGQLSLSGQAFMEGYEMGPDGRIIAVPYP